MRDPYFEGGKWWIDKDPDDQLFYTVDVTDDLLVMGTTATVAEVIVVGVEKLADPTINGGKVTAKLGGLALLDTNPSFCTFRITCENTERFDRTIWFKRIDN
jgi:hypothetical protein